MSGNRTYYPPNRSLVVTDESFNCGMTHAGMVCTLENFARSTIHTHVITQGYQLVILVLAVSKTEAAPGNDPFITKVKDVQPQFLLTDYYNMFVNPGAQPVKYWHYRHVDGPKYLTAEMQETKQRAADQSETWSCTVTITFDGKQLYDYLVSQPMVHIFVPLTGRYGADRSTPKYIFQ